MKNLFVSLLLFSSNLLFAQGYGGSNTVNGKFTVNNGVIDFGDFASDPSTAANGQMYYNTNTNKFRCYQASAWTDCVTSGSGFVTGTFGNTEIAFGSSGGSALTSESSFTYTAGTNTINVDNVNSVVTVVSATISATTNFIADTGVGVNAAITEGGIDRNSASNQTFNFTNSGSGIMTAQVDGVNILTESTGLPLAGGTMTNSIISNMSSGCALTSSTNQNLNICANGTGTPTITAHDQSAAVEPLLYFFTDGIVDTTKNFCRFKNGVTNNTEITGTFECYSNSTTAGSITRTVGVLDDGIDNTSTTGYIIQSFECSAGLGSTCDAAEAANILDLYQFTVNVLRFDVNGFITVSGTVGVACGTGGVQNVPCMNEGMGINGTLTMASGQIITGGSGANDIVLINNAVGSNVLSTVRIRNQANTGISGVDFRNDSNTSKGGVGYGNASYADADYADISFLSSPTVIKMARSDNAADTAIVLSVVDDTAASATVAGTTLHSFYGGGLHSAQIQTSTTASDGNGGTAAAGTLDPTSQAVNVVCNDPQGCTITMQETTASAVVGPTAVYATVCITTQAGGTSVFAAVGGTFACGDATVTTTGLNANDCFRIVYRGGLWLCDGPAQAN